MREYDSPPIFVRLFQASPILSCSSGPPLSQQPGSILYVNNRAATQGFVRADGHGKGWKQIDRKEGLESDPNDRYFKIVVIVTSDPKSPPRLRFLKHLSFSTACKDPTSNLSLTPNLSSAGIKTTLQQIGVDESIWQRLFQTNYPSACIK